MNDLCCCFWTASVHGDRRNKILSSRHLRRGSGTWSRIRRRASLPLTMEMQSRHIRSQRFLKHACMLVNSEVCKCRLLLFNKMSSDARDSANSIKGMHYELGHLPHSGASSSVWLSCARMKCLDIALCRSGKSDRWGTYAYSVLRTMVAPPPLCAASRHIG